MLSMWPPRSIVPTQRIGDTDYVELGCLITKIEIPVEMPSPEDMRNGIGAVGINETIRYDTLPIICPNCGHIRTFLMKSVISVLNEEVSYNESK